MKYNYDIIVIGAGAGGLTVAIGLASAGKKVALVERGKIGGDCTNFGCIPSKALLHIAKSGRYSLLEALEEMRKRRKQIQDEETPDMIQNHGITFLSGFATFKDAHTISIDTKTDISSRYIVISTGSHPAEIFLPGVDKKSIYTNESIFELEKPIKNLVIIGGGYIGSELAEAFANLGVSVSILQRSDRILPQEERRTSEFFQDQFEGRGIQVYTQAQVERGDDNFLFFRDSSGSSRKIPYDAILMTIGRKPNIKGLNSERAGIISNDGIIVDRYQRTQTKHIFAIGDCVDGNPQFTHLANHEGRSVIRNILLPFLPSSVGGSILPTVLYTDIEVARVGKTEEEILQTISSQDFRTEVLYFSLNDRSKISQDTQGFIQIHFARVSGKILGATLVGHHAGEMISILTLALEQGISAYKLSKMMFPYPTKSELIKKVCDKFVVYTLSHTKDEILYLLKSYALQISTGILWGVILLVFISYKNHYSLTNLDITKHLYNFLVTSYWGSILYIIVYALRPIILFPATLLTFMSGALFGPIGGFIYTMIGENLSANFAYGIGRVFGKKIIPNNSKGFLSHLKSQLEKSSFISILMTRLLFFPFDLVNYGAGILKARWSGFFWGTCIGIIPGALVFILAGASIENIGSFDLSQITFDSTMLLVSLAIFIFSLSLAKVLKKFNRYQ